jgi:U4/U6 small nuclear ribonucleoprotein PRP31
MSRGKIEGLITSGAVMAVKVTAATSKGVQLDDREWGVVTGACTMMFDLDTVKKTVSDVSVLL